VTAHWTLAVFFVVALVFPLAALGVAWLWAAWYGTRRGGRGGGGHGKLDAFECGVPSGGAGPLRFKAQYYHYGIVFLVFDVEAAFLLPFAVAFLEVSAGAFLAMLVFVLLVAEGLVWAWGKGVLAWK
jgi:NADH:ubiquinone oxidoreductase subunit 3 (subunit A)